jgi:transcriptional regulator with XRE-family HTH domain
MDRKKLIDRVSNRKNEVGLTIKNISNLSNIGNRTVTRFFNGEDVKLSTLEKITSVLGLDIAGNELRERRANEKAMYIVSLVQDTSSLEMQGLEQNELEILINETKEQFLNGEYQKNLWVS